MEDLPSRLASLRDDILNKMPDGRLVTVADIAGFLSEDVLDRLHNSYQVFVKHKGEVRKMHLVGWKKEDRLFYCYPMGTDRIYVYDRTDGDFHLEAVARLYTQLTEFQASKK